METYKAQLLQNMAALMLSTVSSRANSISLDVQSAIAFNLNMIVAYQNLIKPFEIILITAFCVS